ncbi:hypothetical protein SUGI_0919820 [Cryptomeria japonica]|nr:hypothetical protein SUGI_0919820 [Cryptomeria japonica]
MAEASLSRSDISFRRQGSSGIVWGTPDKFEPTSSHNNIMEARAGTSSSSSSPSAQSKFCYSRSTGSIETRFHCAKPADRARARTGKSGFRFARWIRRIFSKSG